MSIDWLIHSCHPITLDALNGKAALLERLDRQYILSASVLHDMQDELSAHFDVLEIKVNRVTH